MRDYQYQNFYKSLPENSRRIQVLELKLPIFSFFSYFLHKTFFLSHFRKIFTSTLGGVFPLSPRHDPVSKVLKEAFKKRSLTFVIFFVGDETPV